MTTRIKATPWLPVNVKPDPGSGRSRGTFVQRPRRPQDNWEYAGEWSVIDGKFTITEFTIRRSEAAEEPGGDGITPEVLKRTRLGSIIREIRGFLAGFDRYVKAQLEETSKPIPARLENLALQISATADAESPVPKRGRPITLNDDHYQLVARLHLEALSDWSERHTRKRVQELLHEHQIDVSERTVAKYVTEARKRGFLTPGQRGTPYADPGPRLIDPEA